ncbi:hypothetical protein GCM10011613_11910 [Cellvibrio zantedeschiae]|uniref:DUF2789 domain-containing protein n=1 Tax=Cellvibrio zantedeschiae TaxID=1237077 RepID=A0ABQ3AWN5_9GAMM|nr:DUF2789 domain-containing protein [Cellvibrio zantedeschiae]GGY69215.1 hypothetical protein GCM10011613_11910 [Cellvibrio zantedeschiae]
METHEHDMVTLFQQLGLPSGEDDIQNFIEEHPLNAETNIFDASFWTPAQAKFLREQIKADADWAVVIDTLNTSLRQ